MNGNLELARSSEAEKNAQIQAIERFEHAHQSQCQAQLKQLKTVALKRGNTFECLMETVKFASLGQISHCLYEAGGEYRRNM